MAPPNVIGQKHFDLYEATTKPGGDIPAAKAALKTCGHPNGFTTGITYRSDRPKEVSAAQAMQASLAQVGIKLQLHGFPSGTYYSNFAGVPNYMHSHNIGIAMGGWAPGLARRLRVLRLHHGRATRSARPGTPTSKSSTTRW